MPISDAVRLLESDLRAIFADRLQSLVAYDMNRPAGAPARTMAVVDVLAVDDLRACADRVGRWQDMGLATPLILPAREFGRSLDAFPFEFGAILADHVVIAGGNPFEHLTVDPSDIRRACEVQARSHLLHLREGYIETQGRSDRLADLVVRSSVPLDALLKNLARLRGAVPHGDAIARVAALGGGSTLSSEDARHLFPAYLEAIERLTQEIDGWSAA